MDKIESEMNKKNGPDKFDCIFVFDKMTKSNEYQFTNFILPLQEDIIKRGGVKLRLPYYGYVTILPIESNIE